MILPEKTVMSRLNSSDNLLKRIHGSNGSKNKPSPMDLFKKPTNGTPVKSNFNPFSPEPTKNEKENNQLSPLPKVPDLPTKKENTAEQHPTLDKLLDRPETIIGLELAHNNALGLLNRSVQALTDKLDDVRADKLPGVISAASKVIDGIRREKSEMNKNKDNRSVHLHFYTPVQKEVQDYQVIDV